MKKEKPAKPLTDKQVIHMQPDPSGKRKEVAAGPPAGLYLVVHPTGAKSWMFRYRFHGRTRGLTLSEPYPGLSLAKARAEAQAAQGELDEGRDPAVVAAEEKAAETPNMVKAVIDEWLDRAVKDTATHGEVQRMLHKEVVPKWKHRAITEVARPDVLRLLDAIVDRGAPITANRLLSVLKRFFRWCIERGYIEQSPVAGLRPLSKETTRDRVLTEDELREIWTAAPDIGYPFGAWVRTLILTAQRRAEAATMQWKDIDLGAALWTLPAANTKARRIHDVPLSAAILTMLTEKESDGKTYKVPRWKGGYVFSTQSGETAISGYSKAKTAIDKAIVERRKKAAGKAGGDPKKVKPLARWTYHDLRRTAATWMAKNGVPVHVLAAILNHTPGSTMGITAIYARHRYEKERREALQKWAEYVLSLEKAKEQTADAATA